MIQIKSVFDVDALNASGKVPLHYLSSLAFQCALIERMKKEGTGSVQLIHLTDASDLYFVSSHMIHAKTVEFIENGNESFFRINLENEDQLSMVYFLNGTLPAAFEEWLRN